MLIFLYRIEEDDIVMINVTEVSYHYNQKKVLDDINFTVKKGEILGVVGPNGSGKTTLLKLICGMLHANTGDIKIKGQSITKYEQKKLAKIIAVLPQTIEASFNYSVQETVKLGRYAHQRGIFPQWTDEDENVVKKSIQLTGLTGMEQMSLASLSGGECQRVFLSRALAQEPEILMLDEPTNHLDISYQIRLLDSLSQWSKTSELTVIAIFHDLNLASFYCDKILLLNNGKMVAMDAPNKVLNERDLTSVYRTQLTVGEHSTVPKTLISLVPKLPTLQQENGLMSQISMDTSKEIIVIKTKQPFKTLSSAIIGDGIGWKSTFVNRHVHKNYDCSNPKQDMASFLQSHSMNSHDCIGMMTAATLEDVATETLTLDNLNIFTVITAGTSNAVDVSRAIHREEEVVYPGTINMMIFIEGRLTEAAFVQAIMIATEAKTKALHEEHIMDPLSATIASGTSTDSIVIAASQTNKLIEYAGSITPVGKAIGHTVYKATRKAIQHNKIRRSGRE
ncbi:adenosylcobinamide amidohydrolase [Cytobacillus sp. Hm23]